MKIIKLFLMTVIMFGMTVFNVQADDTVFNRIMRNKEINCGYYIWAPNIQKDPNTGKLSGFNYDAMEAIGKTLGLKINWTLEVGPGDISAALAANKIDVMCATMWPSPARFADTTFSDRVEFYSLMYPIVRADDTRFDNGLAPVNRKEIKVTALEGDVTADVAAEKLPNATKVYLSSSSSPAEMLMQVTTKKADVLFLDRGAVNDFSKTNPGKLKVADKAGPVRIFGEHILVKLGEQNLRNILDTALLQLTNDGVMAELATKYAKHFDTTIYPPVKDIAK